MCVKVWLARLGAWWMAVSSRVDSNLPPAEARSVARHVLTLGTKTEYAFHQTLFPRAIKKLGTRLRSAFQRTREKTESRAGD